MVTWLLAGYGLVLLAVIAAASFVALFVGDEERREMAYRVLKLLLGAATGAGALTLVLVRLHELGSP
jgi:hypothetical protein